jgi:hypothetical protein
MRKPRHACCDCAAFNPARTYRPTRRLQREQRRPLQVFATFVAYQPHSATPSGLKKSIKFQLNSGITGLCRKIRVRVLPNGIHPRAVDRSSEFERPDAIEAKRFPAHTASRLTCNAPETDLPLNRSRPRSFNWKRPRARMATRPPKNLAKIAAMSRCGAAVLSKRPMVTS